MKSFAGFKIIMPLSIALSLMLAPLLVSSVMGDDSAKVRASELGSHSKQKEGDVSEGQELEFKGITPAADPFFVDEFFEAVRMQRLKKNVSGGMTSDGLKLRFEW